MITLAENEALRTHLINAGLLRAAEFFDVTRKAQEYWHLFEFAFAEAKRLSLACRLAYRYE
jgi:hypothetical protein